MDERRTALGPPAPSRRPWRLGAALLLLPATAFLALFYFYPLGAILQLSLARAEGGPLAAVAATLGSPIYRSIVGFTFWQAGLSTLATLLVGLPGAYLFARFRFRGQALLRALTAAPFVLPTLVVAAGFNALLGPRGWVNLGLMALLNLDAPPVLFINTLGAIVLAHVFYNTTIVLRLVGDYWSRLDPRLVAAARALGANPWRSFWEITWPLLAPAVSAAALLVFIFDFTSFGVILVLGGPRFATLETEVYRQTVFLFNLPVAAVLALLQLGLTLALTLIYARLSARVSGPVSLRSQSAVRRPLTTRRARLAAGLLAGLLGLLLLAPMLALALRSVIRLEAERGQTGPVQPGFTLAYYRELAQNTRSTLFFVPPAAAIGNSLATAGAVVALALALGLPTAWGAHPARPGRARVGCAADAATGHVSGDPGAGLYRGAGYAPPGLARLAGDAAAGAHAGGAAVCGAQPGAGAAQHPPAAAAGRRRAGGAAGPRVARGGPAAGGAGRAGGGNVCLYALAGRIRRHRHPGAAREPNRAHRDLPLPLAPRRAELRPGHGVEHDPDAGVRGGDIRD